MNRQSWSRSERRLERRQVLLMLVVVAAVGLGCFALGVMVGRSGPDAPKVPLAGPAEAPRLPVAQAPPPAAPASPDPAEAPAPAPDKPDLTFYDSLPRGEQPPLGSGINLPAGAAAPQESAPVAPEAEAAPATAISSPASAPEAEAESFLIQVASFARPDDAGVLQARLAKKGYPAFVRQADLKEKGIWYRVFVGPVPGADRAETVVARLRAEEKVAPLIRKN